MKIYFARGSLRPYSLWLVALLVLVVLASCRQAAPALDRATQQITPEGGVITLPGGATATFGEGFLNTAAEVTMSLSDTPEPYPAGVAEAYPPGAAEPAYGSVSVSLPSGALGVSGDLALRIPVSVPPLAGDTEERFLAEVHLFLADGQHLFNFVPYGRVETEYGQDADGSDTVVIGAAQLQPQGPATAPVVRVTVRPVRLSSEQFETQALPSGFVLEDVVAGFDAGVSFDFAPDGKIYVAEKAGKVRVVQNNILRSTPFADISAQVNNTHDRGLLGLALDPQFPSRPYVYLLFTYDPPEVRSQTGLAGPDGGGGRVSRLIRLTADAAQGYNVAVPGSEVVLLGKNSTYANIGDPAARNSPTPSCLTSGVYVRDCIPADELSHTIGTLRFGKDGSLFVGSGDGSSYAGVMAYATRAQNLYSLAGKILRVNPSTGQGYSSNPFYTGDPNNNRSKVYSYGLRNPFRFAIHPVSGEPVIGDVGWNTWEEVNIGRGKNFGWPCYEGGSGSSLQQGSYRSLATCQTLYKGGAAQVTPGLYAYVHVGGSSVQVGDFYTGTRYPAAYQGALFINDFNQGMIKTIRLTSSGTFQSIADFGSEAGITQMRAGPLGDIYLINIYGSRIKRLRYTGPTDVPVKAVASATPTEGEAPLSVQFSSAGSTGSGALAYSWDFGNGATSSDANPSATFEAAGTYRVTLRVSDSSGDSSSAVLTVRASNASPEATVLSPLEGTKYTVGNVIPFSGVGNDPEDGSLPESAHYWTLKTHHNDHVHIDSMPPATGKAGSFVAEDHGDNTYLELCLTVTDSLGEKGSDCKKLYPNTVAYTLDTVPSGLTLPWEGVSRKTPFTVTTPVNGVQQLIAPSQTGYSFVSWSDGGAATHNITVGSTAKRFVATYRATTTPPSSTLTIQAQCIDRWRVTNRGSSSVLYNWKILSTGRTGSRTSPPNNVYSLWIPSGSSKVTFYVAGKLYGTLTPNTGRC